MDGTYSPETVPAEFAIRWYHQPDNQRVLTDIALLFAMIVTAGFISWIRAR